MKPDTRSRSVAVVSKADSSGGGASRVAEDLAKLLNAEGLYTSHHWLGYAGGPWESHYRALHGGEKLQPLHKFAFQLSRQIGFPDFFTPELLIHNYKKQTEYDIYHFHDISTTFSPIALRWLSKRKPVVWTFHDCSPFTAGCLYPMECTAFHTCCNHCPQLGAWPLITKIDATKYMYRYKKKTASSGLFFPVAPSKWMADEAMKSGMFRERPVVIPYGVNLDVFFERPTEETRASLELPADRFIVLLNVKYISDSRKGVADAIAAIERVETKPLVIAMGMVNEETKALFSNIDIQFLGYVRDRRILAKYCSAADVLLFPTYADNLPNSVLEAMASGTPTIGYSTGGMPEMVEHNHCGWMVETGDIAGLAAGLNHAQSNPLELKRWASNCVRKAKSTYSRGEFLRAHIALYESLLDPRSDLLPHLRH